MNLKGRKLWYWNNWDHKKNDWRINKNGL